MAVQPLRVVVDQQAVAFLVDACAAFSRAMKEHQHTDGVGNGLAGVVDEWLGWVMSGWGG